MIQDPTPTQLYWGTEGLGANANVPAVARSRDSMAARGPRRHTTRASGLERWTSPSAAANNHCTGQATHFQPFKMLRLRKGTAYC